MSCSLVDLLTKLHKFVSQTLQLLQVVKCNAQISHCTPRPDHKGNVGLRSGGQLATLITVMVLYCCVGQGIISRMTAELRRTIACLS